MNKPFLLFNATYCNMSIYVSGNYDFYMYLIGHLINGYKIIVRIKNVRPCFDVKLNNCNFESSKKVLDKEFDKLINILVVDHSFISAKVCHHYDYDRFSEKENPYVRFYFKNLGKYKKALKFLIDKNLKIDDISKRYLIVDNDSGPNYTRKIARTYDISLSNWNKITQWTIIKGVYEYKDNTVIEVDVNDIKKYDIIENIDSKLLINAWDIETHIHEPKPGDIPYGDNINAFVDVIGTSFSWNNTNNTILRVVLVTYDKINPIDDTLIIKCKTEKRLILAWIKLIERMNPDIMVGFNDFSYDFKFIFNKIRQYNLIIKAFEGLNMIIPNPFFSENRNTTLDDYMNVMYQNSSIKYDASSNMYIKMPKFTGIINVDVYLYFQKTIKNLKSYKLDYLLTWYKLENKDVMPYETLHYELYNAFSKLYSDSDSMNVNMLTKIAKYCVIDCVRTNELMILQNYYSSAIELASLSWTSIQDTFIRADGPRVLNLLAYYGLKHNIYYPIVNNNKNDKYTKIAGGLVLEPMRGFYTDDPVGGLDFKSLYPSIIQAYNISSEKLVTNEEYAKYLENKGYKLYSLVLDDGTKCWTVCNKFGVVAEIENNLFNERNNIRNDQKKFDKKSIKYSTLDVKQLARKTLMNTFYGQFGSNTSPMYEPILGKMITKTGRNLLKFIKTYSNNNGGIVKYGDTDSIYIASKPELYKDIMNKYYNEKSINKETYWSELIKLCMNFVRNMLIKINKELITLTKSKHIVLAYEEILHPVCFIGKKKYFGRRHINKPELKTLDMMIRGLHHKDIDASETLRDIGDRILNESCSLINRKSLSDIVLSEIDKFYNNTNINTKFFIKTSKYKPKTNNIKNNTFIDKLKRRKKIDPKIRIPDDFTQFNYVIIKNDCIYNPNGYKVNESIGNKMELYELFDSKTQEIDIDYYFNSEISIFLCRLLTYRNDLEFNNTIFKNDSIDMLGNYKEIDTILIKNAEKFINYYNEIKGYVKSKIITKSILSKAKKYAKIFDNYLFNNDKRKHFIEILIRTYEKYYKIDLFNKEMFLELQKYYRSSIKGNYNYLHNDGNKSKTNKEYVKNYEDKKTNIEKKLEKLNDDIIKYYPKYMEDKHRFIKCQFNNTKYEKSNDWNNNIKLVDIIIESYNYIYEMVIYDIMRLKYN